MPVRARGPSRGSELERRLHRFFWHLGYFVRRDVDMLLKRGLLVTDLDVFAIRFDSFLRPRRISVECKHADSGFSSILQLRGIADYYGVETAVIVRESLSKEVRRFLRDMNMMGFTHSHLEDLEAQYGLQGTPLYGSMSPRADEFVAEAKRQVAQRPEEKDIAGFLQGSWMVRDPFVRFELLCQCQQALLSLTNGSGTDPPSVSRRWLIVENFILSSLCAVEIASSLVDEPRNAHKDAIVSRLLGGESLRGKKKELIGVIREVIEATKVEIDERVFSLDPPYAEKLNDLVGMLLKAPELCQDYLRFNDYVSYEFGLFRDAINHPKLQSDLRLSEAEVKLFADYNAKLLEAIGTGSGIGPVLSYLL